MAWEAMEKVTQAEAEGLRQKAEAEAAAKQLVSDAHRAGKQALAQSRSRVQEQVRAMLREAEERAAARREQSAAQNRKTCDAMRENAQLEAAAQEIVRRVMEG